MNRNKWWSRLLRIAPVVLAFALAWSSNATGGTLACWVDSQGYVQCLWIPDDYEGDYAPNPGECVGPQCPDDPDPPNDGDDGWG